MTHDEARSEIACWRGTCLNYFTRIEAALNAVLEAAFATGKTKSIRHLSGQKFQDVVAVCEKLDLTAKQTKAFAGALDHWEEVQNRRPYLAHGVAVEAIDRNGQWIAVFDLTTYKGAEAIETRWTLTKSEAADFQQDVSQGFKKLTAELGQMRTRLQS